MSTHKRFLSAICKWRGSIWKYMWKETIIYLILYYFVRMILAHAVPAYQEARVKSIVKKFDEYTRSLPLEFLLGFYVSQMVSRWWNQTQLVSSPHEVMSTIVSYINEANEECRKIRHTVARYLILYYAMGYKKISSKMAVMFPNTEKFQQMGLMTKEESEILNKFPSGVAHEIVFHWILDVIRSKADNQRIILHQLNDHRAKLKMLIKYNDVSMPLVYTQTVTIVVYGYFAFALIGHQFYADSTADLYFPFFTVLRFIFSLGWLKVAEYLSKPFGDDDDDIDMCKILISFCNNVFVLADYPSCNKPEQSWENEECQLDGIKWGFEPVPEKSELVKSLEARFHLIGNV